tara:strand:+ start:561 stop:854 length:294 start_codon:yes stop_codon:yes gene_type:complete
MSKILKISFMTLAAIFLIGCGGDSDMDAMVDSMVSEGEVNAKEARCILNNMKGTMTADQWASFVSSELEGTEYSGDPWEVVGMMLGSAAVCGVEFDF